MKVILPTFGIIIGLILYFPMLKNHYRAIFLLWFLFISTALFSQNVGINTTGAAPSINAILDLNTGNANNSGIIIPNVTLGALLTTFNPPIANAPTAGDNGMMVYNVGGPHAVGYYYWNGVTWVSVSSPAVNGLSLGTGIYNGYIELGGPTVTPAPLIQNSVISGSGFNLDFDLGTYAAPGTGAFLVTNGGLGTPLLSVTSNTPGVGVNVNPAVSTLDDNGSFGTGITNIAPAASSTTPLTTAYSTVIATPSALATTYTLTLPSATADPRQIYTIVYNGNNLGTINITSPIAGSIMLNGVAISPLAITAGSVVLQSDGANWNVITGVPLNTGQSAITVNSTASVNTDVLYPSVVPIPGLTESINLTSSSYVVVQTHGMTSMTSGGAGAWAIGYLWIDVDGTFYFLQLVNLCTYTGSHFINTQPWAGSMAFNLAAGAHTIAIYCDVDVINNAVTNAITFAGPGGTNYVSYETVTILHQ